VDGELGSGRGEVVVQTVEQGPDVDAVVGGAGRVVVGAGEQEQLLDQCLQSL